MTRVSITRKINVVDPASAPSWYTSQTVGTWKNVGSALSATSGVPWLADVDSGDTNNYRAIFTAWGGGILNTEGVFVDGAFVAGRWMVCFGGGHGDYAGNELYAWGPLESETPAWKRLTDPTIPAPNNVKRDVNGYPVSRHTYDTLVFLPATNQMLCFGAPGYFSLGFNFRSVDLFDFTVNPALVNPWTSLSDMTTGNHISSFGDYNPTTGEAWSIGRGNDNYLARYASGTVTQWAKDNPLMDGYNCKAAIDSDNNLLVFAPPAGTVIVQNLSSPTSSLYTPTTTGAGPSGVGQLQFNYDATGGRFVVKGQLSQNVWFLEPGANPASGGDAWAWSMVTAGGDALGAASSNGVFGRTRLVSTAAMRGLVTIPDYNAAPAFFKF